MLNFNKERSSGLTKQKPLNQFNTFIHRFSGSSNKITENNPIHISYCRHYNANKCAYSMCCNCIYFRWTNSITIIYILFMLYNFLVKLNYNYNKFLRQHFQTNKRLVFLKYIQNDITLRNNREMSSKIHLLFCFIEID